MARGGECSDVGVRGGGGGQDGWRYLQNTQGLEAPEGPLGDMVDGVVSQAEAVEVPELGQTALVETGQVIVRQIPGERERERERRSQPERHRRCNGGREEMTGE